MTVQWAPARWRACYPRITWKKPLANELLFGSLVDGGQLRSPLTKRKNELEYGFQSAQKHKPEAAH